jgi:hypothetical protein
LGQRWLPWLCSISVPVTEQIRQERTKRL